MSQTKIKSKLRSFTLLELMYVMGIIGLIMPAMFALYNFMLKANREITARQSAIQQWYEFFERLNILVQDYRIDYEEYYNRQMVGCNLGPDFGTGSSFTWNVWTWWNCKIFTTYWNWNSTNVLSSTWYHDIYYCTSEDEILITNQWEKWSAKVVTKEDCGKRWWLQSYGQYAAMFTDVKKWTEGWMYNMVWDWDDEEIGYLLNENIQAIQDPDNIQELYLISQDWKNRLFFRRKLVDSNWDFTQYKLQMLRLKWFDAGRSHYFPDEDNRWIYDWKIDTWVCDSSMWFIWSWASIDDAAWIYSWYHLPADIDDCWIDMTYWLTNVLAWNISVSPTWNPDLYWAKQDHQINDYIKIFLANGVYVPAFWDALAASMADFNIPLETTLNMEWFYK